jgi:hypothetical protein
VLVLDASLKALSVINAPTCRYGSTSVVTVYYGSTSVVTVYYLGTSISLVDDPPRVETCSDIYTLSQNKHILIQ